MNKTAQVRKWLGVPCCLSTVALFWKGILELPMTSCECYETRHDVVFWVCAHCLLHWVNYEDVIHKALERKTLKYAELVVEARQLGWQANTRLLEIGVRGFVAKSTTTLLLDFGFQGRSLKGALKELSGGQTRQGWDRVQKTQSWKGLAREKSERWKN